MAIFNSLDTADPLSELDRPLIGAAEGTISAATRKERARANLGITANVAELAFLDGVVAGTSAANKAMVTGAQNEIGGTWKDFRATSLFRQVAPAAHTGTVTLTAANLAGGLIVGTPAAAATYTLPTGTLMDTHFINAGHVLAVDDAFEFSVINAAVTDTFAITIAAGAGWTLVGEMVIPENDTAGTAISNATFRARRTGSNAWTLYRVA
jgi:hypothetical protein